MIESAADAMAIGGMSKDAMDGFAVGSWAWLDGSDDNAGHPAAGAPCRVVERFRAWGTEAYDVWVQGCGRVVRVRAARLRSLSDAAGGSARGFDCVLRVARTTTDLDESERITKVHTAEAIRYRLR